MEEFLKQLKIDLVQYLKELVPGNAEIPKLAEEINNELTTQFPVIYELCIENKKVPEKYKELSNKIPEIKEMSEAIYAMAIVQAIKTILSGILGLE